MRLLIALAALALAASPAAADPGADAAAPMAKVTRQLWKRPGLDKMTTVQQVWTRTVGFDLPRPFVPSWRAQGPANYTVEYIPDGETSERWTRMITVSGTIAAGAARMGDAALASAVFGRAACPGYVYRDLGSSTRPTLGYRSLVIGCGAEGSAGSERAVIAMFHDAQTMWTVQYAERGALTAGFERQAAAKLARLAPMLTCRKDDRSPACLSTNR